MPVDAALVGRVEIIGVMFLDGRIFAQLVIEEPGRSRFHLSVSVRIGDVGRAERLFPVVTLVAEGSDNTPSLEGCDHASDRRGILGLFQLRKRLALRYCRRHAVGRGRSRDLGGVDARTVGVVGRHERHCVESVVGNVAAVLEVVARRTVVRMEQAGGSVDRQPRFDLGAELHVQVVGRVFVGVLGVETLFGVVVAADQIVELFVAAADAQVMIPRRLGVVEEVIVPVEVGVVHVFAVFLDDPGPVGILGPVVAALVQLTEVVSVIASVGAAVVGLVELVGENGRIVTGRDEIRAGRRVRNAETTAVIDAHFAVGVVFRGDQDHAETGAGAIDRRRGRVLEHRYRLHVVGVHPVDVAFDAVDEHERRSAAVDRRYAADVEVGLGARESGAVGDVEVGDHALQGLAQRRYRPVLELFGSYL